MRQALIVQGGWDGHEPAQASEIVAEALRGRGFEVEVSDALESFRDSARLKELHLIVLVWTMGKIGKEELASLLEAVSSGTGLGGWHGGMGDSFREATAYQYMVGGQWVEHPGGAGVTYRVHITDREHPVTRGMEDFEVTSEQYYMHVDPANRVLATTTLPAERNHGNVGPDGGGAVMPVTWVRRYDEGRVFYTSLGHVAGTVRQPEVLEMITRGLVWAARGE
jgi:hypothetical protein